MTIEKRSEAAPVSMRVLLVVGALALLLGMVLFQQFTEVEGAQPSVNTVPGTIKDIARMKH